jgi:beta-glucosidase-like glycosyl hydrolase
VTPQADPGPRGPAPDALHRALCGLVCVHVREHRGERADALLSEREAYPWGGYAFFGGDLSAVRDLVARLRQSSEGPLLFASDLERGLGQQLEGGTAFPPAMTLGAAGDPRLAREVGRATAREAAAVGLNCVFAPVLDLANEPANPIVCTRAFGQEPEAVAELGAALLSGLRDGGVLATAKHFPGHGRTRADSHAELPVVRASAAELRSADLVPFRAAIAAGVDLVMSAHVAFPALEPDGADGVPATLSRAVLTELLRGELGFRGVVVSDALMMGALEGLAPGEREARALEAGVDCLLYPPDPPAAVRALAELVQHGRLAPGTVERAGLRLRRALERIEAARALATSLTPATEGQAGVAAAGADELALRAARAGLVALGEPPGAAPGGSLVLLLLDGMIGRERVILPQVAAAPRRDFAWIVPEEGAVRLPPGLDGPEQIVLAYFSPIRAWKGRAGFSSEAAELAARVFRARPDATLISFGSPFIVRDVPELRGALLAFGDVPACQKAVGEVLTGEWKPEGRLPVRV